MSNEAKPWKDPITDEDLDLWIRCCPDDYMARQLRAERGKVKKLQLALVTIERSGFPGGAIVEQRSDDHVCGWCRGMLTPCPVSTAKAALKDTAP